MKKTSCTVWTDAKGRELLVQKGPDEFYVPLSTINTETLKELAAATTDATTLHLPSTADLSQIK